jgi:hypothetical protein
MDHNKESTSFLWVEAKQQITRILSSSAPSRHLVVEWRISMSGGFVAMDASFTFLVSRAFLDNR